MLICLRFISIALYCYYKKQDLIKKGLKKFLYKLNIYSEKVIATKTERNLAEAFVIANKLENIFTSIYSETESDLKKEDGSLYNYISKKFNLQNEQVCIIDDNWKNIQIAKSMGYKVIAVNDNHNESVVHRISKSCDKYINDFTDLT